MTTPTLSERIAALKSYGAGPGLRNRLDALSAEVSALESERDALRAEVVRLREALHPGPMPTYSDGVTMCCERQHETGLWVCGPFAELPTRLWCNNANRYEALTGLDAMTGEKR